MVSTWWWWVVLWGDVNVDVDADEDDEQGRRRATGYLAGVYITQGKTLLCLSKTMQNKDVSLILREVPYILRS